MDLELFHSYRNASSAKEARALLGRIVVSEDPLINKLARRVARASSELDDLMQAGRMGIATAIQKFDPSRGQWTTYATQWCMHEMNRQVVSRRALVGGTHWTRKMPKTVVHAIHRFKAQHGREPTVEEMGVSKKAWARWTDRPLSQSEGFDLDSLEYEGAPDDRISPEFVRCMMKLGAQEQRIFLSHIFQETTLKKIATNEGISFREVATTFERSKRKIQTHLGLRY